MMQYEQKWFFVSDKPYGISRKLQFIMQLLFFCPIFKRVKFNTLILNYKSNIEIITS